MPQSPSQALDQVPVHHEYPDPAPDVLDGQMSLVRPRAAVADLQTADIIKVYSERGVKIVVHAAPHRPPTWTAGRLSGSGSASLKTSWVTGAVSPSPKSRNRKRYTMGLPSVH